MEVLRYGATGTDVELLQLALTRSGYYAGQIDGIFGSQTLNAVRRFQSSFGLAADGIVGAETWRALRPFLTGYFTTTIRGGDTFFRLAKRYDTTVNAIVAANPSLNPDDLQIGTRIVIPYGFELVPTNIRYTSTLMGLLTEGMRMRYPFIGVEEFGRSVMGKPLVAFSIGKGEAQAFYNSAHHANEWITVPIVMKFMENYLNAYINKSTIYGRSAENLYNNATLYIAPMVNPDGVDLVNGAIDMGSTYYSEARRIADNYPAVRFPSGWKANIVGTDLNLNYPAGWETAREVKFAQGWVSPAPRDYVGTAPLSAPESRAVYEFTQRHDFRITLSYHTQGQVIYWKYQDIEPPRGYEIGTELAQVSGYLLDDVPFESGNAGYKDWFILTYNRPGYTVEAGRGVNPLPLSQFGSIYNDNVGIMTVALANAPGIELE